MLKLAVSLLIEPRSLPFDAVDFGRSFPFDHVFLMFLKIWDSTTFVPSERSLKDKIHELLRDMVSTQVDDLVERVAFHSKLKQNTDSEGLARLLEAFTDGKRVSFVYASASSGAVEEIEADPVQLVRYNDDWYLFADTGGQNKRVQPFRWSRVDNLQVLDEPSHGRVATKDLEATLASTYGIFFDEDAAKVVTLAFRRSAIAYVEGFRFVGETERRNTKNTAGETTLEVDLRAFGDGEVVSDALGWGADCEVVRPTETRELWLGKIREMYGRWGKDV